MTATTGTMRRSTATAVPLSRAARAASATQRRRRLVHSAVTAVHSARSSRGSSSNVGDGVGGDSYWRGGEAQTSYRRARRVRSDIGVGPYDLWGMNDVLNNSDDNSGEDSDTASDLDASRSSSSGGSSGGGRDNSSPVGSPLQRVGRRRGVRGETNMRLLSRMHQAMVAGTAATQRHAGSWQHRR